MDQSRSCSPLKCAIRERFAFLHGRPMVNLAGRCLTLSHAPETEEDRDQAAHLTARAARRSSAGEHGRAVALYQRVVELQPPLHSARRSLASYGRKPAFKAGFYLAIHVQPPSRGDQGRLPLPGPVGAGQLD
jgi:hypothetical protein